MSTVSSVPMTSVGRFTPEGYDTPSTPDVCNSVVKCDWTFEWNPVTSQFVITYNVTPNDPGTKIHSVGSVVTDGSGTVLCSSFNGLTNGPSPGCSGPWSGFCFTGDVPSTPTGTFNGMVQGWVVENGSPRYFCFENQITVG